MALPKTVIDLQTGSYTLASDGLTICQNTIPGPATVQRTNSGFVAPGQTAKTFVGQQATSTTVTTTVNLYTVTAGKTYIITDIALFSDTTAVIDCQIQAAGTTIFRGFTRDIAPLQMPGIETQPNATAGQAVTLLLPITGSGIVHVNFFISGVEQ
jgi:hypothetical protein